MSEPSEPTTDDVLLARIAMGAADALAALFRRRQADVYRFALHMSGAAAVAEDVTQDVFVIVMRDAGRYEPAPDLEILVMTKHSDPRTGETTYSLSNITRGEPAAGLFDVPADYTIQESSYLRTPGVQ